MRSLFVAPALVGLLACATATAQTNNPAAISPDTNVSNNTPDQLFARQASLGGKAEVELARLAESRSQNAAVKEFARHMIQDHGKANDKLAGLAKSQRLTLRDDWDTDHKVIRDQLSNLRGAAFDDLYIRSQITDHQKTAQLLEWHITSAQNEQLKSFSIQTLPTVLAHLEAARQIQAQLASSSS